MVFYTLFIKVVVETFKIDTMVAASKEGIIMEVTKTAPLISTGVDKDEATTTKVFITWLITSSTTQR